jgi:hypothetical protein
LKEKYGVFRKLQTPASPLPGQALQGSAEHNMLISNFTILDNKDKRLLFEQQKTEEVKISGRSNVIAESSTSLNSVSNNIPEKNMFVYNPLFRKRKTYDSDESNDKSPPEKKPTSEPEYFCELFEIED